jgi:LuxR family maltose regulon positive regulatory protein
MGLFGRDRALPALATLREGAGSVVRPAVLPGIMTGVGSFRTRESSLAVETGESLLLTKLFVPQVRARRVARPALVTQLNRGLTGKLTLVSAPAGFGKTTLVADWLQQGNRPFTWLSLDEGDNEPARFLVYLAAALRRIRDGWSQIVETALRSPQPPSPRPVIAALINEIASSQLELILALDDYHAISHSAIHEAVTLLVDHMPPTVHLVLVTRADPPLPLARLRARGQLNEIRANDLRFTVDEAGTFLNQIMDLHLAPEQIATLKARTEGWIAGLQLAALSLQGLGSAQDVADLVDAFAGSHRYVVDYMMEEVFGRQDAEVQGFLLQTSILDRLSGPLCDAILDQESATKGKEDTLSLIPPSSGGQAILEYLEGHNLFTLPLDCERRWYRYHHLFADLLRDRLRETQSQRIPELHRRAAVWYEHHGLMEEAVHHALKAQDYALAVRLIRQVAFSLWRFSENYTLLSWMRAMPETLVRSYAGLSVHYAAALIVSGQLEAAEPWLQSAEARLLEQPTSSIVRASLGHVYRLRAYAARFLGTPADVLVFSRRALEYTPADRADMRGVTLLHIGHAHLLNGSTSMADQALREACEICRAVGHPAAYLSAAHYLAQLRTYQGLLRETEGIYRAAIEFVAEQDKLVCAGIEQVGLGDLLREWNDLEAAAERIDQGLELAQIGGDFVFLRDAYLARARLELALGDLEEALTFAHRAEQLIRHHRCPWETALVELWKARLYLAQGDLAGAAAWARTCTLSPDDELRFVDELGHVTLAQVLLAQGRLDPAGRLLERLGQAAESAGRWGRVIQVLIVQALVRQAAGDEAGALACLERSLALAEPEGYVRTFLDAGPGIAPLLRRALDHGMAPDYVAGLLGALAGPIPPRPPVDQPLIDPLTPRELEVLHLIYVGLRNQEIADQLIISLATVKRHISNIYGKLGVSHRTQAIACARELGLLADHA